MRKIVEFLEEMFRHDSFAQFVPVERTCVITQDDAGEKGWEEITEWAETVRDRVSDHAEFKVKGWTIRDHGACYCERFPCPLPHVEVLTEKSIWRYAVTAFFDGKSALLSCKRLSNGDSVPVAGVNLDSGAAWLTNEIRRLCLPMLCRKTVVLDRRPCVKSRLKLNKSWTYEVDPTELAEAIRNAADVVIFLLVHTVEAAITSFIPENFRLFYYPAVVCSGAEQTAKVQTDTLRRILAAFTFIQGLETPTGLVPELAVQSQEDLKLLQSVSSIPVLVHIDLDAMQKKMTTLMQSAQTDLAASGKSRLPLGTVPILVGSELPSEHVSLLFSWGALEPIHWEAIDLLRTATANLLRKPQRVANRIASAIQDMSLADRTYPTAHFLTVSGILDELFLAETSTEGVFLQRAESLVDQIWNNEEAREKRFAAAFDLLQDPNTTAAWIADSAKEMAEGQIGFLYAKQDGTRWVAFELKEAFPQILLQLGLKGQDSVEFRAYLKKLGILESSSEKIRGQAQKPSSHVLFPASKLGYEDP